MNHHTLWMPYTQMQSANAPLEITATQGTFLITADGRRLVDGVASWWTACHGYNPPHIVNAIIEQAHTMPHVMLGGIVHPQVKRLAERVRDLLPGDLNHIFFANTGSESIEIAMKMAIQFWLNQGISRNRFLSFQHGYHGDTLFAMSVCDPDEGMHHLFHHVLPQQYIQPIPESDLDFDQFNDWLGKHKHHLAGVIIEPLVQGAGGMKMYPPEILRKIAQICKSHHLLLIADEIFTGFGRTGSRFAVEQASIVPDIICLSKALTGGTLPLALTAATTKVYEMFLSNDPNHALMHGPTYMGNALGCAAANASLDLFERYDWQQKVENISAHFKQSLSALSQLPFVKEVRILGAIAAIQLQHPVTKQRDNFTVQCIESGVWLRPFGDIVYTTPCFTIEQDALNTLTDTICAHIHVMAN